MPLINEERIRTISKDLYHIGLLIVLILLFAGVLSWVFGCEIIPVPSWCDIYWGIMRWAQGGMAQVLIVYGDGGLGDYKLLQQSMEDPRHLGVRPQTLHIDRVSIGTLSQYDLVIVTEAREIGTEKLDVFIDYISQGGRLVWTGDAGVELAPGDKYLYESERPGGDANKHEIIGPWARKEGTRIIPFDEFIGVQYIKNYCDVKDCEEGKASEIGMFDAINRDHQLIYGIRADLRMYGNFAIVDLAEGAYATRVLDVDYMSNLLGKDGKNYGRSFPVIVTTGLGEKVAYYSIPPEMFLSEEMPIDPETGERIKYWSFIDNMYRAMLK